MPRKNWLEWLVFGCGVLLVLGTVGFLARDAMREDAKPADVIVRLGRPRAGAERHAIPVTVINVGGEAATGVRVQVALERDGTEIERAELEIPFLPRGARREGWVTFGGASGPDDRVRAAAVGYERP
jgi:uncharacterized protein (TIGR02588 family)